MSSRLGLTSHSNQSVPVSARRWDMNEWPKHVGRYRRAYLWLVNRPIVQKTVERKIFRPNLQSGVMGDWGRLLALLSGCIERGPSITTWVEGRTWRQVVAVVSLVDAKGRARKVRGRVADVSWEEMIDRSGLGTGINQVHGQVRAIGKVKLRAGWSRDRSDRRVPASVSEWQFPGGATQQQEELAVRSSGSSSSRWCNSGGGKLA